MAPQPRIVSTEKGKARVYSCASCGDRHAPPTGAACPRSKTMPVRKTKAVPVRKPGRPRKQPVAPVPDSEDEPLEAFLTPGPVAPAPVAASRKRALPVDSLPSASPAKRRTTSDPRQMMPDNTDVDADDEQDREENGTNHLLHALMAQMNAMSASNEAERQRVAEQQRLEREAFQRSLEAITNRVDDLANHQASLAISSATRMPPQASTSDACATRQSAVASTSAASQAGSSRPEGRGPHTRDDLFPHGQPLITDVTPRQLQEAIEPVRDLRRDTASADVAEQIMKVVGLLEDDGHDRQNKSGYNRKALFRKRLAKWPSDYVFRWNDENPAYDSLTAPEFVSGFMSIIEEVLPIIPQNLQANKLIHYLRNLMEDCPSSGWEGVRRAHKQVLNAIEYKRLKWEDTEAVYKVKTEALLHIRHEANEAAAQPQSTFNTKTLPCPAYQTASCTHEGEHISDTLTLAHFCAFCLAQGNEHPHPMINCHKAKQSGRNKGQTKSKNSKGKGARKGD